MSGFLFKTILFGCCKNLRILQPTSNLVGFVGNPNVCSLRFFSTGSNQQSFTVSYLVNSLGLSPQSALKVSKYVDFDTSEKPEKVIKLFEKYGFTQIQISSIVRSFPRLLVVDTEKFLLPKLEFFDAKGVSWPQFAKRLSSFPNVLARSLDNQIQPSYEFLRNFLDCDEKAIATVEKYPNILVKKFFALNVDILREHGVPNSSIAKLIPRYPEVFAFSSDWFIQAVEEVVEMGFNPKRLNFIKAVLERGALSKSTWESKVNAFKKWGWCEEDILRAFQRNPGCMKLSEDKIMAALDFFANKMDWRPSLIVDRMLILDLSLTKTVIPRFSVFQALLSKGLVKKQVIPHALFNSSEAKFLQKFVMPYKEEAPELLMLYKEKLDLSSGQEIDDKVH